MKLKLTDEWWTAPTAADNGRLIIVTGRREMSDVKATGLYVYRVEITWRYDSDSTGMPGAADAELMGQVHDAIHDAFKRDPVAVLTGVYTGDGERNWVLYTRSLHIFRNKINEVLAPFDVLPLEFAAYEDPEWDEYNELCQTEIE